MADLSRLTTPARILLVDDEQDILDILSRVLGSAGYDVSSASNGQAALDRVSTHDYDLIITNIRMPIMDGESFYRQLRDWHPHLSRRVIFCTGDVASVATQRFLNSTGAPVIFKPFPLSAVLETVSWKLAKERAAARKLPLPLTQPETAVSPAL